MKDRDDRRGNEFQNGNWSKKERVTPGSFRKSGFFAQ